MAENKTETAKSEITASTAETKAKYKQEPVYTLDVLKIHCNALFGVSTAVFAGATAELDATKKYTRAKVKTTIEKWLQKEVK